MERLDVAVAPERANIEAAIHFARYAIGKGLVKGKRVLDIACGEGYGSYLLKQAGADSVIGVDISAESVMRAQNAFASKDIKFIVSDAKNLENLFPENSFDLVISVETIEHVEDPVDFLRHLKRLTKPDGVIVLSCPNDHWYFPEADRSNPYHRRKYRMDEFQDLCTAVLGNNVQWSVGTGVFGFASTPLDAAVSYDKVPGTWMSFRDAAGAYLVNGEADIGASATQCSYFVGVWNAPHHQPGVAVFPLAMDEYADMVRAKDGLLELDSARATLELMAETARADATAAYAEVEGVHLALLRVSAEYGVTTREVGTKALPLVYDLEDALKTSKRDQRHIGLRLSATQAESEAVRQAMHGLRETIADLQAECSRYRIGYERYIRLRSILPSAFRSWAVRIVKSLRSRGTR